MQEDICARKSRGSPESREAFAFVEPSIAKEQAKVLAVLAEHPEGLTGQQVEGILGKSCCSISARMSELKKSGLIRCKVAGVYPDGRVRFERRLTKSGASAGVYIVKDGVQ
jgi:hypothetical protein